MSNHGREGEPEGRNTAGAWWRRLRLFLRRDRATAELEEEMHLHRELSAEQLRTAGASEPKARAQARRAFGNATTIEESSRDQWGFGWLESFGQDIRYAVRRLRQRPGFSLSVIVILALGIGATTAMFSAVDAAMLRPLPFPHPEQLLTLPFIDLPFQPTPGAAPPKRPGQAPDLIEVANMHDAFSHVAAYTSGGLNLTDPQHPQRVNVGVVTTDFFATLGVAPTVGSTFPKEAGIPGGPSVALLSWGLWQRQYGGRDVLGRVIRLNDTPYTVVGVMPRGFSFPLQSDLWIPCTIPVTRALGHLFHNGYAVGGGVIGRAATTAPAATARLMLRWQQTFAVRDRDPQSPFGGRRQDRETIRTHGAAIPLKANLVEPGKTPLMVLFGATGFLLLIACINVANLLLSAASERRHEIAVRQVIGARRARLIRQLFTESLMLAGLGAGAGLLFAPLILQLTRTLVPASLGNLTPAQLDLRVLAFAGAASIVTAVAFGVAPALGATRMAPGQVMKSGGRAFTGNTGYSRRVLIGAEVTLAVILLIGAGLMLHSFSRLMGLDRGMNTHQAGSLRLAFPDSMGRAMEDRTTNAIRDRLLATPGITAAGFVSDAPLADLDVVWLGIDVDDATTPALGYGPPSRPINASPGYFAAMGISLLHGRDFRAADDSGAPVVAIVNQRFANGYWRGVSAIGRTFRNRPGDPPITVVGEIADARDVALNDAPTAEMYFPPGQAKWFKRDFGLVARGALPPGQLLAAMRNAVHAVDPTQAVYDVRRMDDVLSRSLVPRRTDTILISAFALLALLLATVGVYSVAAYNVTRRAREFGIRSALGASDRDLISTAVREMLLVGGIGLLAGLGGAWALSRVIAAMLYGVAVHDPVTFVAVPLVLSLALAVATLLPARRALHVNPAEIMRAE